MNPISCLSCSDAASIKTPNYVGDFMGFELARFIAQAAMDLAACCILRTIILNGYTQTINLAIQNNITIIYKRCDIDIPHLFVTQKFIYPCNNERKIFINNKSIKQMHWFLSTQQI